MGGAGREGDGAPRPLHVPVTSRAITSGRGFSLSVTSPGHVPGHVPVTSCPRQGLAACHEHLHGPAGASEARSPFAFITSPFASVTSPSRPRHVPVTTRSLAPRLGCVFCPRPALSGPARPPHVPRTTPHVPCTSPARPPHEPRTSPASPCHVPARPLGFRSTSASPARPLHVPCTSPARPCASDARPSAIRRSRDPHL